MQKEAKALTTLAEVIAKSKSSTEGMSLRELMAATGWGEDKTRALLVAAKAQGKLTAGRKMVPALDGINRPVPVYKVSI